MNVSTCRHTYSYTFLAFIVNFLMKSPKENPLSMKTRGQQNIPLLCQDVH